MTCPWCKSPNIRTSRFRRRDLPLLFLLRYPIRCLNCNERDYMSFSVAWRLHQAETARNAGRPSTPLPH